MTGFGSGRREERDPESRPGGASKDSTILLQTSSAARAAADCVSTSRREGFSGKGQNVREDSSAESQPAAFGTLASPEEVL
jgi:hypothetical protein